MMDDLLQIIEEQADVIMRPDRSPPETGHITFREVRSDTGRTGLDY